MVVLDTCALVELGKDFPAFSAKAAKKLEDSCYMLSISFAEIACKMKLGKLEMRVPPQILYAEFSQIKNFTMIDIGVNEWLDSIDLDWKDQKDPVDRVITAFAMKMQIPIVSSDKKIKAFYKNVIW